MSDALAKPDHFNFSEDVVDYWASKASVPQAMHWISQDTKTELKLSYAYFSRRSHRVAAMLKRMGAKKGDRMIIILPRVPAWWEIVCGAIRAGIVVCPCTTLLVDKDIEYRSHVSRANIFVGDASNVLKFLRVKDKLQSCKTILQVGGPALQNCSDYDTCLGEISQDEVFPSMETKAEDACMIYFTSGTTGLPKMVLHNQVSYPLGKAQATDLYGRHS
jgi:medium-chain acyl-CoA synthetase